MHTKTNYTNTLLLHSYHTVQYGMVVVPYHHHTSPPPHHLHWLWPWFGWGERTTEI